MSEHAIDLGETPIEPVWLDDGCDWQPTTEPTTRREVAASTKESTT